MNKILDIIKNEYKYITNKKWSLEDVGRHWDSTLDYDEINKETYSYFRRFIDGYQICNIADQSYVLDICCRTGNGTDYFSSKGKIKTAVCADISEEMLKICSDRLSKKGINFKTIKFNSYNLPFDKGEFDSILCFETVEHVAEPDIFIKELGRVIKKNGEMILTTPNILWEPVHILAPILGIHHSEGPHRFIGRHKLHEYIKDAGFEIQKEKTTILIPNGPKILIKFGDWLEKIIGNWLMNILGLRRIFICKRV